MSTEETVLHKETPVTLKLSKREKISKFITIFSFDLPSNTHTLGTKAGQYISIQCVINDEKVVRYYSPLSPTRDSNTLDLAIKFDGVGKMSKFFDSLEVGAELDFYGPIGGFEYEANKYKNIALIAGGTGISPMLQIVQEALKDSNDKTTFKLLYGAIEESELILKEQLDELAKNERFQIYYTLDNPTETWKFGKGYITQEVLMKQVKDANCDQVVICGPPKMCQIMDKMLFSIEGYNKENVFNYGRW
jgi:cytochrome-b5 reductase